MKLAALLCVTAGFVNAAGFLGFSVLTTNVTGHAALFAERIAMQDWQTARVVALWMFLFLAGAFISSLTVSLIGRNQQFSYVIPILMELLVLLIVGLAGYRYDGSLVARELFAGSLLFVMGLQNALVSMISGSVVRTTHLTGTFTDLGIELAQIIQKGNRKNAVLRSRIKMRAAIISFFLFGALLGAYLFNVFQFHAFLFPVAVLLYTLFYDIFRISIKRFYRNLQLPWKNH
ncbi:YoaK family protein [Pedobacter ginsengisoli]|uniref:YoaK family protein n=1 Tax=Pedobacter ginsengisoli TaxID=363852 RepID=UPI001FE89F13|nr:YoaK family protein [Pedobacter ginsengisoli]